jgi:HSP20 family protein
MTKFLQKQEVTNPFAFMRRLTDDLERVFGLRPEFEFPELYPRIWSPPIEVLERNNTFLVRVDLPGLTKENVKIEVSHDELTIEGERTIEKEERDEGLYRTERTYGTFFRRVPVPDYVRAEEAVATFKDGVLQIEMPAIPMPEAKKRTLAIQG